MLAIQHVAWFGVGLVLAVAGIAAALRYRTRSRRWLLAGILFPFASATLIAWAVSGPSFGEPPRVTLLLDFSASARTSPWHDPAWVQALAQRRLPPHQPLTVIAFAGTQRHTLLPDITPADPWPAQFVWDVSPTAGTDIPAALAESPADNTARWIITDGLFPPSAIPPHLERTAFTILPPTASDAAIRNLVLHPADDKQLEIMIQLAVTAITQPATARVTVERDGIPLTDQAVEFQPSTSGASVRWLTLRDPAPSPTPCHYTAHIQLPGDPWPENNRASAVWPGPSEQRTLIVGTTRPADLLGTFIPTDRFTPDAAQLASEGWQTIILSDVPAEPQLNTPALSPAAARALDRVVRDYGGGLVLLANSHAFGPGHYGEGAFAGHLLEELSPVSSRPQRSGGLSVLFLLDASSSLNELAPGTTERKFSVLSRAVQEAAACLADNDALTLVTFNNTARLLAIGTARDARPRLAQVLASVQPSSGTNPDIALPQIADFMQFPGRHLVVLLTDGEIPAMDISPWHSSLQTPDTHLAIIAPPSTSAAPASMLQQLAAIVPQSSWSQTADPASWAGALRNAILDQVRGTVQSTPLPWQTADNNLSATATTWTRTWLKPESTLLASQIQSPDSQLAIQNSEFRPQNFSSLPVAALAQRGLGKVAALTISDDASPPYQALRQRLLDAVAASPGDRRFTAAAERGAEGWLITVDALDAGKFLDGQKLSLKPLPTDGVVPLLQTAPGHYEAHITSAPDGLAAAILRQDAPDQLVARLQAAAFETTEYPATVQNVARLPFGVTLLPAGDGPRWTPPAASFALAPWLWLLAAATALAAIWTRK